MALARGFLPKISGVRSDTRQLDLTLNGASEPLGRKLSIAVDRPVTSQQHNKGKRSEYSQSELTFA